MRHLGDIEGNSRSIVSSRGNVSNRNCQQVESNEASIPER